MQDLEARAEKLRRQFERFGQDHVFRFWGELTADEKRRFLRQLEAIDLPLLDRLAEELVRNSASTAPQRGELTPPEVIPVPRTPEQRARAEEARKAGEALLRAGKVGVLLVAGGQGTRLGFNGPKGKFPITPVKKKTLFRHHAEKILALTRRYGRPIPWLIMTSEANDAETRAYFAEENNFGLPPGDVIFFQQDMIPAVDESGKFFLERKDRVFTNPNGHGGTLLALRKSGALDLLRARGIEELFYFQVDNVLIQICDPVFIGYHIRAGADMSCKVVAKRDPYEKVGVIGYLNGRLTVIEYSDLTEEEMTAANPDGSLRYNAGSIAIHMLRRAFVEELTEGEFSLPYHRAHKKIPHLDEHGRPVNPAAPNGYKFETFIFDALQYARSAVILEVERKKEFSPVKNAKGIDSPATAQQDLVNYWAEWLEAAGVSVPRDRNGNVQGTLEISPLFALDEEEFLRKVPAGLKFRDGLYLGG